MLDFRTACLIELKDFLHILSIANRFPKAALPLVSRLDTTPYMVVCSHSKYRRGILPQLLPCGRFRDRARGAGRLIGRDAKMN